MEYNPFWRIVRMISYLLISQFIIFAMQIPTNFLNSNLWLSTLLFVVTAVMISRRPGSANIFVISMIALSFAIYTDEGVALGGLCLLTMSVIIRKVRPHYIQDNFLVEWLMVVGVFAACLVVRNLLLVLFFTYHYSILQTVIIVAYFALFYPAFNIIAQFIFRARNEEEMGLV